MISLSDFKIDSEQNVYAIGTLDGAITIHSQQIRAATLAYLLDFEPGACRKGVCIIGGGICGLTLSYFLLELGWTNITILERLPELLSIQNGCDTRYVHPNLIDWPHRSHAETRSSLPQLQWNAGSASNATYELENAWLRGVQRFTTARKGGRKPRRLTLNLGVTYVRVTRQSDKKECEVEWIRDASVRPSPIKIGGAVPENTGKKKFNHVIFATGFGIEDSKFSYWRNEDIGQVRIDGTLTKFLISGLGDGAISDLLRVRVKNFRIDRALEELNMSEKFVAHLAEIKNKVEKSHKSLYDLFEKSLHTTAWKDNWENILGYFEARRREDTRAVLHYRGGKGFSLAFDSSPASFLNKLFLYFLYKNGDFQYVDKEDGYYQDYIRIDRHGVDRSAVISRIYDGAVCAKQQPVEICEGVLKAMAIIRVLTDFVERNK